MSEDCVFCKVVRGKLPAYILHKDDDVVAFHDINPQAPVHILLVPKRRVSSLLEMTGLDDAMVGNLVRRARDLAREMGLAERGFRLVLNAEDDAGYSVYHIHLHLIGGRRLGWPPG